MLGKVYYKDGGLYWSKDSRIDRVDRRVGSLSTEGYRVFSYEGKQFKEHRVIFEMFNGYCPDIIDHINGVKDDNHPENLREANPNQNQYNRDNVKGYRKFRDKYEARISYEGKRIQLGHFNCPTAAHIAFRSARKRLYGEWVRNQGDKNEVYSNAG